MDTHTVFFVGKPGCGKGTQAKLLSEATGWPIKVASDGLRELIAEGGAVGRKLKETMDAGLLTPSWFTGYIFIKWISALPAESSIIFDGTGRRVPEAELIIDSLTWLGRSYIVLDVHISDETTRKRLAIRKDIEGRVDDSVVEERLREFHTYTEPALDVFRNAGAVVEIDGEPSPEEVFAEIKAKLNIK